MKTWFGHAVILSLATVLCVACAPTPVVPSGASRVPVNSEEGISHYRERVKVEQRDRVERNRIVRQVDALTKQIQELKAYVTLLQRQQQESEKGPVRQVQHVGTGSPPLLSRAPDKTTAKSKEATKSPVVPPITAVPHEAAVPPMIPIKEGPTDLCGQKIGDAKAYRWVDPTSDSLSRRAGLRAEHGLCRHIASSSAPSAGQ
jgi:TolA-binding protein